MIIENNQYSLLDSVSIGICIIDKEYIIQFWNEYMEQYTGFTKDEITGKLIFDVFPAFQNDIYKSRIKEIFNGWPPVIFSSRLHTPVFLSKDIYNPKKYQDIIVIPIYSDDTAINHVLITINDVTNLTNKLEEQKQLYLKSQEELKIKTEIQGKLVKSEKQLKELNATKDKFFSLIAHDLISPFNVIIGYSNFLNQAIQDKNYSEANEFSNVISNTAKQTHSLLINLLEWSRIQTGRISFNPIVVNAHEIFNEIIDLLKNHANQKEININVDIPNRIILVADINMLKTVIRNLLSNAIKYTLPKGNINVSVYSNSIGEFEFSISDNGIGIEKENIEKIFSLDINFSTIGTADERGTGLGLLLCKEFIDYHKGKIWVNSEVNKGSDFRFTLPLHKN